MIADRLGSRARVQCTSFFSGDIDGACEQIINRVREQAGGFVCETNVHVLVSSWHDRQLRAALDKAWLVCPDGAPIAWMMRHGGSPQARRIAGADLMARLIEIGQADGLRHFLFGSTNKVLRRLENSLLRRYPKAEIVGRYSPGAVSGHNTGPPEALARITRAQPDIVWCGLGAPKQEFWMQHNADLLKPAVLVGVGAAFDFQAGTKKRAPEWMQNAGLEWAHRLASEPHRMAHRYLRTNPEFIVRATLELAAQWRKP